MAKLEGEVFLLGLWKNFDDLEESICLAELYQILESSREKEQNHRKFLAAIKGIDLSANDKDEEFERVKRQAEARLTGKSEEEVLFNSLGIQVIEE